MKLKAPSGGCVVRMYRQGLGDCFLLAFGTKDKEQKYVLIDCGVLIGTQNADTSMKQVVSDIQEATGGHLDILVITHEHWDHISGFIQAQEEFDKITVDQVWLSWTEDPKNPLARELRNRRKMALNTLRLALNRLGASKSMYTARIQSVWEFFGTGLEAVSVRTEEALDWVKKKWTDHQYCTPGDEPLTIKGLPNVHFFVLGPPTDIKYIRKSSPSKGQVYLSERVGSELGLYLKALGTYETSVRRVSDQRDQGAPFNPAYACKPDESAIGDLDSRYRSEEWRTIDTDWLGTAGELALQLDTHTNNTSLVLAIELSSGGHVLLFPGDAQVGNWLSWEDVTWTGKYSDVTAKDLLAKTVLYKVGHHGSHNATLKEQGLERMTSSDLSALIPVDRKMAAKKKWRMPYKPLWDRLTELTGGRVVLVDKGLPSADGNESVKEFLEVCSETELYIDVKINSEP
jgi:beta-lactamase superfamily II metal-dependent hydrolase